MKNNKPMDVASLLGTKKTQEQVQAIQNLMQPVITLTVQLDLRTNQVAISRIGPEMSTTDLIRVLERARESLQNHLLQQMATHKTE